MQHIVIAPDSFKGTLASREVCDIIAGAVRAHFPDARVTLLPLSDGGEGMADTYLRIAGGQRTSARVCGPLGAPVDAAYGILPDGTAVMEMSACAGLPLMKERRDPLRATTRGVGEMLLHAADQGISSIILGLGGSATNDGGIGMAAALGYRFLDADGRPLAPLACNLGAIRHIEPPAAPFGLRVTAACDVNNPLCGPDGASAVFGPQKGVTDDMIPVLDTGLNNLARVIKSDLNIDVLHVPGAGAAGGMGAGVMAFLNGTLTPGVELLLDAAGFDSMLEAADLVITGEGRMDRQTAHGKAPVGVSRRAKRYGVPCIALCGALEPGFEAVYAEGITAAFAAMRDVGTFADVLKNCREDLAALADAVMRLIGEEKRFAKTV